MNNEKKYIVPSETADDVSNILSVLEGSPIYVEVDASVRKNTEDVAAALKGIANVEQRENEELDIEGYIAYVERQRYSKKKKKKEPTRNLFEREEDLLKKKGWTQKRMKSFEQMLENLEDDIRHLAHNQSVDYYVPLPQGGGIKGSIMHKIRRFTRRFLEFIFAPILEKQNLVNAWSTKSQETNLDFLKEYGTAVREECMAEIYLQEWRNQILQTKVSKQEKDIEELRKEIEKLKRGKEMKK